MAKYVEVTYPGGAPTVCQVREYQDTDGTDLWVVGHGNTIAGLREQHRCQVSPLIAMTPERVEALRYILQNSLDDYNVTLPETQPHVDELRAMLDEAKGDSDEATE